MNIFETKKLPGYGTILGDALGRGLSTGLGALAEHKMSQIANRNLSDSLSQTYGISKDQADAIAQVKNPEALQQLLKSLNTQQADRAFATNVKAFEDARSKNKVMSGQPGQPGAVQGMAGEAGQPAQQAQAPQAPLGIIDKAEQDIAEAQKNQDLIRQIPANTKASQQTKENMLSAEQENIKAAKATIEKERDRQNKAYLATKSIYDKQGAEYDDAIDSALELVDASRKRREPIRKMVENGEAPNNIIAAFYDTLKNGILGVKFDLTQFIGAKGELFNKLKADWIKEASKVFKGSIRTAELEVLADALPSLSNTPEGIKLILDMMDQFENDTELRATARNNIKDAWLEQGKTGWPPNYRADVRKEFKRLEDQNKQEISQMGEEIEDQLISQLPDPSTVNPSLEQSPDNGATWWKVVNGKWVRA